MDSRFNKQISPTKLYHGFASMCVVNILVYYQDIFVQTNVIYFLIDLLDWWIKEMSHIPYIFIQARHLAKSQRFFGITIGVRT